MELKKAIQPTIYFIGVTTAQSSIMKVFPEWAKALGLGDTVMKGIDIAIHEEPGVYRKVVQFIKDDPLSLGALVTTHKIDLYNAAKNIFDYLDPFAQTLGEISSISKLNGQLRGHAKDPISSGLAMEAFIPRNHWKETGAEVFIMGAGGSAIAIGAYLMQDKFKGNYPSKIVISNRSQPRLIKIQEIFEELNPGGIEFEYHLTPEPKMNDAVLKTIAPNSLIVNATGLGKDRPGSPLTDECVFPKGSYVWEINYRGDLWFMHQALEQQVERKLHVEDGWIYFIHGWTQVIGEVFQLRIDQKLSELNRIASQFR